MFDIHTIRLGCFSVVEVRSYVPDNNNMMRMNQLVFKICHGIAHRANKMSLSCSIIIYIYIMFYHVLSCT